MAFRQLRPAVFVTGATLAALLASTTPVHAQDSAISRPTKKSVYDPPPPATTTPSPVPDLDPVHTTPTPTERLALHIGAARRFLHAHTALAQRSLDAAFTQYLHVEHSVTHTLASLAPPRTSEEKVAPGALYVAVTAMAGTIIARRRVLPVRVLTPVAVAVGAGWYFLPETSRNVADLVWEWEKRVPGVAERHLQVREAAEGAWRAAEIALRDGRREVDVVVREGRRTVEGWVKKSGEGPK